MTFPLHRIGAAILSILFAADSVPKLDVEPGCKAAEKLNRVPNMSEGATHDICIRDEDSARRELEKNWASYPPRVRERCMTEATQNVMPSYVEALVCIRVALDPDNKATLEEFKKQNRTPSGHR